MAERKYITQTINARVERYLRAHVRGRTLGPATYCCIRSWVPERTRLGVWRSRVGSSWQVNRYWTWPSMNKASMSAKPVESSDTSTSGQCGQGEWEAAVWIPVPSLPSQRTPLLFGGWKVGGVVKFICFWVLCDGSIEMVVGHAREGSCYWELDHSLLQP